MTCLSDAVLWEKKEIEIPKMERGNMLFFVSVFETNLVSTNGGGPLA